MIHLRQIEIGVQSLERFAPVLSEATMASARTASERLRQDFAGRVFWNVNSTGLGGGVAEMLRPLIGYARGVGVDARWLVIQGNERFFHVTKRLHHALHGSAGDGSPLDDQERRIYESTLAEPGVELASLVRAGDVVLLHDPQTAGMAPYLAGTGAVVIWRCHIGHDEPGDEVRRGWKFLAPYLDAMPAFVFSREAYVPDFCDHGKANIIAPSIDAFSPKNQHLDEVAMQTILVHTGLVEGPEGPPPKTPDHAFTRDDGTPGRVEHRADVVRYGRPPLWHADTVVQVSRWDPLKDPLGVMAGFAHMVEGGYTGDAQLILAGPDTRRIADDPERVQVLEQVRQAWSALEPSMRNRVHLASLPTDDVQENAAIVNALQRHATVVVQKSLHEGFGLTVTEAMWKRRPVVASAVGGIQDQIRDGVEGENARLKKLVAERALEIELMREVARKKW